LPKRVLLEECLPRHLKRSLEGHEVRTVPEAGWASKENGELLALAAPNFDVFVTVDRNLTFQHNPKGFDIGVIVLIARGNRLVDLLPLVPRLREAVETVHRGEVVRLGV
jgi:hypothetical protein